MVETRLQNCLGCQATTYKPTRDPLKPTPLPERPWQHVDMDFWGPLPSGEHLLVIIDEYSRYPEVEFVRSTSAQAVIPHLDRVFSTHGFPETVKTDGGPPFNGHEYQQYMQWAGIRTIMVSPEDPEANGLAENFMKAMNKIWHIAHIEGKNHKQELYKFLRHYRATPHSSTGRAPAEVLFNRKFQVRLPQKQEPAHNTQIRRQDQKAKEKQKKYKDAKTNTKPHNIKIGDQVLLLQKQTKSHPRYDPAPYKVIAIQGTQITAARGSKIRKRDAQRFKVIAANPVRTQYRNARNPLNLHKDDTFTYDNTTPVPHPIPAPEPTPQQLHQPEAIPQRRQHDYPNGHLDPNINPNLPREHRNRNPTKHYNPHSGTWT